jgi:hypothetical protein
MPTPGAQLVDSQVLADLGAWFAAGYFEEPAAEPMRRWSRAVRRRFEHREVSPYRGGLLYPRGALRGECATASRFVEPSYSYTWTFDREAVHAAMLTATPEQVAVLQRLEEAMLTLEAHTAVWRSPHTVGGRGYTHSIPNYGRVLREGLDGYAGRIDANLALAQRLGTENGSAFTWVCSMSLPAFALGIAMFWICLLSTMYPRPVMRPIAKC